MIDGTKFFLTIYMSYVCNLDPAEWTEVQIRHWLRWAMQEFKVDQMSDGMWNVTGEQLCQMTLQEFQNIVPSDPQNLLWTHIELLRKCRIFGKLVCLS